MTATPVPLSRKDLQTDQEVRWCPGCGDYAILSQLHRTLPELGIPRERFVFVSGIGCSSRFPYPVLYQHLRHALHPRPTTGGLAAALAPRRRCHAKCVG